MNYEDVWQAPLKTIEDKYENRVLKGEPIRIRKFESSNIFVTDCKNQLLKSLV